MASGYIKDDQGGTFIPASQRPDGSWRKPRRVRDGYVPQEEVPLYESKGKQFVKNKPTYPVGLPPEFIAAHKAKKEAQAAKAAGIPGLNVQNDAAKKKKKKKSKSKSTNPDKLADELAKTAISESEAGKQQSLTNYSSQNAKSDKSDNIEKEAEAVDPVKRLRNLKKKIRGIESLDHKIKSGEINHPEKEMLEKISKKALILREIEQLEESIVFSLE